MSKFCARNTGYFIVTWHKEIVAGVFLHAGAHLSGAGVEIVRAILADGEAAIKPFIEKQKARIRNTEEERRGAYEYVDPVGCELGHFIALEADEEHLFPGYVYRIDEDSELLVVYRSGELLLSFRLDDLERALAAFEQWDELTHALSIDERTLEASVYKGERQLCLFLQNGVSAEFLHGILHSVQPVSLGGTKFEYTRHYSPGGKLQDHGEWQLTILGPEIDDQFHFDTSHLVEYNTAHIRFGGLQTNGPFHGQLQVGSYLQIPIQTKEFSCASKPPAAPCVFQTLPLLYDAVASFLRESQERLVWLTVCASIVQAAEGIAKGAAEADTSEAKTEARKDLSRAKKALADIGFERLPSDVAFVMAFLRLVDDAEQKVV